jgi:hypothetical protein
MRSGETTLGQLRSPSWRVKVHSAYPAGVLPVIAVFILATLALILVGGTIARLAIPALCTGTAYVLYRRAPVVYVSFVWWLWFLICFLRRLVDYRSGFAESNPILAAPFLAALVCAPTLIQHRAIWKLRSSWPFVLAFSSVLYGLGVGLIAIPKKLLLTSALGWLAPLVFAFFIYSELVTSERREAQIECLQDTFLWGALIMGCYGIVQFVAPAPWDIQWMLDTQTSWPGLGSIGVPEPFGLRVFSTMNGPGAFALTVVPGLVLVITRKGWLPLLAGMAGCGALLLTSVRTAWLAVCFALLLLALRNKKYMTRLILGVAVLGVCLIAAMSFEPVRDTVTARFQSFTNIQDDTSFQDRGSGSEQMVGYILEEPMGMGLGTMDANFLGKTSLGPRDSGLWEILLSLGWLGGLVYLSALALLVWNFYKPAGQRSTTEILAGCITAGIVSQLLLGSVMVGVTGCTIWVFAAIGMAAHAEAHGPLHRGANAE